MKKDFKCFTLAEVLMANEERGEKSHTFLSRTNEPKAPFNKIKILVAFTLAEVLITLAIIGVVASLTIPNLIKNYEKHQTEVALKKVYVELNQAVQQSVMQNGSAKNWDFGNRRNTNWDFANKYFFPYL